MTNLSKKQLLIFSGVAIVLSVIVICSSMVSAFVTARYANLAKTPVYSGDVQQVPNTPANPTSPANQSPQPTQASPVGTTTVQIIDAVGSSGTTSSSGSSGSQTTAPAKSDGVPRTVDEIVAYYVAANNKVKDSATKVTKTYANSSNYNGVVEAGALSSIGSLLMNQFLTESPDLNEEHTDDIADSFPPGSGGRCHLTSADVAEATCKEENGVYTVYIKVKPDNNPKTGYGTGSICSIITDQSILDAAGSYIEMSNVLCAYDGAYIEAKIDKATGNMTDLTTYMPMYLSLTAKAIFTVEAKVGLLFEEKWTVTF